MKRGKSCVCSFPRGHDPEDANAESGQTPAVWRGLTEIDERLVADLPGATDHLLGKEEDEDFEQTLRDIHTELADLNKEAVEPAAKIQANFEELGI